MSLSGSWAIIKILTESRFSISHLPGILYPILYGYLKYPIIYVKLDCTTINILRYNNISAAEIISNEQKIVMNILQEKRKEI